MPVVLLGLIAGCAVDEAPVPASELGPAFDQYVEAQMTEWGVPGVVVIVARAGADPHLRFFGTRRLGSDLPISDSTRLQIASNTKGVTGLALGLLVQEGRLSWDDRVVDHVPEYSSATPGAAETTIRDLMSHQAGLPGGIRGGFYRPERSWPDVFAYLAERELDPPLRERFSYSNTGIALAGEIVARVTGGSWGGYVHERLFSPLGMESTYADASAMLSDWGAPTPVRDAFLPAVKVDGAIEQGSIEETYCDMLCGPAGGIWTTPADLGRYVQMLSGYGTVNGMEVLPSEVLDDVWHVEVPVDRDSGFFDHPTAQVSYARGWASYEHAGRQVFEHGGGWMSSFVAVMPKENLAIGLATNAYYSERAVFESLYFLSALKLRAFDILLGESETDWSVPYAHELGGGAP